MVSFLTILISVARINPFPDDINQCGEGVSFRNGYQKHACGCTMSYLLTIPSKTRRLWPGSCEIAPKHHLCCVFGDVAVSKRFFKMCLFRTKSHDILFYLIVDLIDGDVRNVAPSRFWRKSRLYRSTCSTCLKQANILEELC